MDPYCVKVENAPDLEVLHKYQGPKYTSNHWLDVD